MSKARDLSNFISDATVDATEIADLAVTHAKLHTDMNLSSKTLTFAANQISGNSVDGGVISNFASTGIDDNASATAVTILSDGKVGIGTNIPTTKLHVDGAGSQPELRVSQNSTYFTDYGVNHIDVNGPNDLRFLMGGSERARFKSGGDVSIGSDHSGFSGWRVLNMRQLSTGALINFEEDDGTRASTLAAWGSALRYQTHIAGGYHKFETDASTNALQINDNGHVVVNIHQFPSNPTGSKLNVFGDGEVLRLDGTGNTSRTLRFRGVSSANPAIIMADGSLEITNEDANTSLALLSERDITIKTTKSNGAAGHVKFYSYNTEIMRIDGGNNNVGIGASSPGAKLTINADAGDMPALVLGNVDGGGIAYVHRNNRYLLSNGSNWIGDGKDPIAVIGTNSNSTDKFPSAGLVMHNESQTDNTFSTPIVFGNRSNSGAYNTAYAYIAGRKVGQGVDSNWSTGELWIDTAGRKHNGNDEYMDHSPAIKIRNTGTVDMRWQPFSYGTLGGNNLTNGTGWTLSPLVTQGLSYNNNASHGYGLTVAEPGYYMCYGTSLYSPGANGYVYIGWAINGNQMHHWHSNHSISSNHDWVSSIIRWCNAGDHLTIENSSASVSSQWGGGHSQYYVWKVG